MASTSRRSVLVMIAAAALMPRLRPAAAAAVTDRYPSNTALYADPALTEGVDYGRRHRRHDSVDQRHRFPQTTIIAPHGGGIEPGTSELCLAIAGYHPADLVPAPAGGPVYDYWMLDALRASNNAELHVTSTHCDDAVALSLCAGAANAVALHGCTPSQAGLPGGTAAVLVGGRDESLKQYLLAEYAAAGIRAVDAASGGAIDGDDPANIVNRTRRGAGAQLELTTPLRSSMFGVNTRPQRKHTTTEAFWSFAGATRAAIARIEADRPIR